MDRGVILDLCQSASLIPGFHFEYCTRAEEADIEFHEEIHLTEDDGDGVLLCPREGKPDRGELCHGGCEQNDAGFDGGKIAGELNGGGLLIPDESELLSD
jgi:hypothetical protein